MNRIAKLYELIVLKRPVAVLVVLALVLGFFAYNARYFKLDASADSLLLEDDRDLKTFRTIIDRYGIKDFLLVTFEPQDELFSRPSLDRLKELRAKLAALDRVDSVISLLDIPLLKTSGLKLTEISLEGLKTLADPDVDLQKAKAEILSSPMYKEYALSVDGKTTAMLINRSKDERYETLLKERDAMLARKRAGELDEQGRIELKKAVDAYDAYYETFTDNIQEDIVQIRAVMEPYKQYGTLYLGGVSMIANDTINFIRKDLVVFGIGVFLFIVATLTIIFKEIRWVVLPLVSCFFAVVIMVGVLGFVNWKVTVISSNFISLMLILTMSMNIHLAVRYRQLCHEMSGATQREVVLETACKMVWPCLYTALTTILAFSSLVFSGIRPVIDFGWMMTIGLSVTFGTSFILFPSILVLMKKSAVLNNNARQSPVTRNLAWVAVNRGGFVIAGAVLLAVVSGIGVTRLKVENSFINYFREKTEIFQGMKLIDEKLGGTTPLEVIINFGPQDAGVTDEEALYDGEPDFDDGEPDFGDDEPDFGDGDDDLDWAGTDDAGDYWLTPYKIERIKQVHDYLESLPEVGKVLSFASIVRVIEDLNNGKALDGIELGVMNKKIPPKFKADIMDPYIAVEQNEARLNLRIMDSFENIRRQELLNRIARDIPEKFGFKGENLTITGFLVLYNNMLQSLFKSQIMTLGIVLLGIGVMLLVLFRSFTLAIIGIIPNLIAVGIVLGIMGLMDIPLDMMTITIAAITMGIAIDNSIHYIYRFKEEYPRIVNYNDTLRYCHGSVGKAIVNTSITIIFGFSILVMSNFRPTIYFGVFTGLAMFIAMLAVLALMPRLIVLWKPFKS